MGPLTSLGLENSVDFSQSAFTKSDESLIAPQQHADQDTPADQDQDQRPGNINCGKTSQADEQAKTAPDPIPCGRGGNIR